MTVRPGDASDDVNGFPEDEYFSRRERGADRRQRLVSDFVRKAIEGTVGSVQSTSSISREALQFLLQQGDRGRREVLRIVANEVGEFLRHADLSSEVVKILSGMSLEISANIRFKPTGQGGVKPEVSLEVKNEEENEGKTRAPSPDAEER